MTRLFRYKKFKRLDDTTNPKKPLMGLTKFLISF